MPTHRLARDRAVLLVIDVQERLVAAMPPAVAEAVVKNTVTLIEGAARLGLPIIASEQYPKGLGRTVAAVETALAAAGQAVRRIEKVEFSIAPHLVDMPLPENPQWIVAGMECHVCVLQTARDLAASDVYVVADAVCSRTDANYRVGLEIARGEGCVVTSTETALFDLIGRAGTDDFKAIAKLVK